MIVRPAGSAWFGASGGPGASRPGGDEAEGERPLDPSKGIVVAPDDS